MLLPPGPPSKSSFPYPLPYSSEKMYPRPHMVLLSHLILSSSIHLPAKFMNPCFLIADYTIV